MAAADLSLVAVKGQSDNVAYSSKMSANCLQDGCYRASSRNLVKLQPSCSTHFCTGGFGPGGGAYMLGRGFNH